jgi:CRISPR type III-B/RAMP module RAMP protein Cmr1
MERLPFKLKLVTPAFVAGAMAEDVETELHNDGQKPRKRVIGMNGDGLRIPSLRGVLRFWYRAKEGAVAANLAKREALVFGGTETGQGLRILPRLDPQGRSWQGREVEASRGTAKAYLGYGPMNDVPSRKQFSSYNKFAFREAIPEGTEFSFLALGTKSQVAELKRCLLLLHLFGGIGGRSRRGWGSVEVIGEGIPVFERGQKLRAYADRVLELVWPEDTDRPSRRKARPPFSAFSSGTEIKAFPANPGGADRVMQIFHERFKATRLYNPFDPEKSPVIAKADHRLEAQDADFSKESIEQVPQRLAFGLPYLATLGLRTGNKRSIQYEGHYTDPNGRDVVVSRRASPLFLKVLRDAGGAHYGISLFLKSDFFGHDGTMVRAKDKKGDIEAPDYRAVEAFLQEPTWITLPVR